MAGIFEVPGRPHMDALFDLHLWDTPLIDMRFAYRPEKPLYLVVIRAFALDPAGVPEREPFYVYAEQEAAAGRSRDVHLRRPIVAIGQSPIRTSTMRQLIRLFMRMSNMTMPTRPKHNQVVRVVLGDA